MGRYQRMFIYTHMSHSALAIHDYVCCTITLLATLCPPVSFRLYLARMHP